MASCTRAASRPDRPASVGCSFGEQDPVAQRLRQLAPGHVHVVTERGQDVAQVLSLPGTGPRGHRALADAQGVVGHHRGLCHRIGAPLALAVRAGALRCVRREIFRIQHGLVPGVAPGARVQHAQRRGQRGDARHRRAHARRAALLLQRHRRWQALHAVHLRRADWAIRRARIGRGWTLDSAAAPRQRACRRPATTCPIPRCQ